MQHTNNSRTRWRATGWTLALWLATGAWAHTLPISYLTIVPDADYLHLELTLNPFELSFFAELDRNHNARLDAAEFRTHEAVLTRKLLDGLQLRLEGKLLPAAVSGILTDLDSHHFTLRAQYAVDARHKPLSLTSSLATCTSGSHITQVTYGPAGHTQAARLDLQSATVTFDPAGQGAAATTVPHVHPPARAAGLATWLWLALSAVAVGVTILFLLRASAWSSLSPTDPRCAPGAPARQVMVRAGVSDLSLPPASEFPDDHSELQPGMNSFKGHHTHYPKTL